MDGALDTEVGAGARHFIGNRWLPPDNGQTIDVLDPSFGTAFERIARGNSADVDYAVAAARAALGEFGDGDWGRLTATERGRLLMKLATAIEDPGEQLARLESRTTGKPLKQGRADAAALARYFEYYAGAADKLHGDTIPYQAGMTVLTIRASRMASRATSFRGTTRCRSSAAASAPRWRPATPVSSSRPRMPASR